MMKQFDFAENFVAAAPKINIDVKNDDTCHERRRRCVENIWRASTSAEAFEYRFNNVTIYYYVYNHVIPT